MRKLKTIFIMGLFAGLFGCNSNKQEKNVCFPKENFSVLEAEDSNGKLTFATIDMGYKDYKFKNEFPWSLIITIAIKDKNANGHPTGSEAEILNNIEDSINAELKKICVVHYLGRTTMDGWRDIYFYLDDPEKANKILKEIVNSPTPLREMEYKIEKDNNWAKVAAYLK